MIAVDQHCREIACTCGAYVPIRRKDDALAVLIALERFARDHTCRAKLAPTKTRRKP